MERARNPELIKARSLSASQSLRPPRSRRLCRRRLCLFFFLLSAARRLAGRLVSVVAPLLPKSRPLYFSSASFPLSSVEKNDLAPTDGERALLRHSEACAILGPRAIPFQLLIVGLFLVTGQTEGSRLVGAPRRAGQFVSRSDTTRMFRQGKIWIFNKGSVMRNFTSAVSCRPALKISLKETLRRTRA